MLDQFQLEGPNGTHECLVLELLGPSIPDVLDVRFKDDRLPAKLAKRVARQALLGLDYLHKYGIGHGGMLSGQGFQFSKTNLLVLFAVGTINQICCDLSNAGRGSPCRLPATKCEFPQNRGRDNYADENYSSIVLR